MTKEEIDKDGETIEARSVANMVVREAGPSVVVAAVMLSLIFGGCCSNVSFSLVGA